MTYEFINRRIILDSAVRNGKECQDFDSESLAAGSVARADIPVEVDARATSDSGSKGWCYLPFRTAESRIIETAENMIRNNMDPIEGCRLLCKLAEEMGEGDNELFSVFQGIESETDHYLIGNVREHCQKEYLHRIDQEKQAYLEEMSQCIFSACREVLGSFR